LEIRKKHCVREETTSRASKRYAHAARSQRQPTATRSPLMIDSNVVDFGSLEIAIWTPVQAHLPQHLHLLQWM
jgi:hypothetical protein